MQQKQIKKILIKQIVLGYINVILSLIIIVSLILWGVTGSPFGYIILFLFIITMLGAYFQSDKGKNIFIEINKVNSYSQTKALELVNKNIKYCEESKKFNTGDTSNIHFSPIINNIVRTTGFSSQRTTYAKAIVKNQISSRKKNKDKVLDKKIKELTQLKGLLESITKPQDAWEI